MALTQAESLALRDRHVPRGVDNIGCVAVKRARAAILFTDPELERSLASLEEGLEYASRKA